LAELPVPISSSEASQQYEYPTVAPLSSTHWAISSGSGSLYILKTSAPDSDTFTGEWTARYDLTLPGSPQSVPFLIQSAHAVTVDDIRLLVSRSVPGEVKGKRRAHATTFEIVEMSLDPAHRTDVDGSESPSPSIRWILQGSDLPYWCVWSGSGWIVLSEEPFGLSSADEAMEEEETPEEEAKREREEKIAKLGLGASLAGGEVAEPIPVKQPEPAPEPDDKVWPFSWTQDADTVNVTIPLPAGTERSDFTISLTASTLSLTLRPERLAEATSQLQAFLSIPTRTFFNDIDHASTTYVFDAARHVVELSISKAEENNRWPAVFLPEDEDEEEVPETLSASVLAAVRETFSSIKTRQADEPEGNHPAIPALLREEMDFDLDDGEDYGDKVEGKFADLSGGKVGRDVLVGHILDGKPSWSKQSTSVLATPLRSDDTAQSTQGVILKSAVDGLLFSPESGVDPATTPWTHISTVPALAFVMSSKRDLRTVRYLTPGSHPDSPTPPKRPRTEESSKTIVLAFDAGSSSAGQGNVYIYYPPTSKTTALQGVIGVSGGERGALLGVGCVSVEGKDVVVALCEKELVILGGVL
jgi:hypothetical protein